MMGIEKQETKTIMFLAFVWLSQLLVATAVDGASIAINFADDDGAEAFSGGKLIGPTDIDSRVDTGTVRLIETPDHYKLARLITSLTI